MIGRTLLLITILISGFGLFAGQVDFDQAPQMAMTAPIYRAAEPVTAPVETMAIGDSEDSNGDWFIEDANSHWTPVEKDMVNQIVEKTLAALEEIRIDGSQLMEGYNFRRVAGEHVDEDLGLVALVNHDEKVINLADSAFLRMNGFYIYHELGHVVDRQLDRRLSQEFHAQVGGNVSLDGGEAAAWRTADGFWMRAHAHEDREEATADAFALWVTSQVEGYRRPVFAGMPLDADYQGIIDTMATAVLFLGDVQAG